MTFAILTTTGRNKEAAAIAAGTPFTATELAWGDGTRIPSGAETSLENEQGRKAIQGSGVVPDSPNTAFFEILLDENEGPFVVRELGLFDGDGDMVAVAHYDPPVNKPLNNVSALFRMHILFSDLENLIIKVMSTDAYVPAERKVSTGAGLTGGGDMSADRTLAVDFASNAEALAGLVADKSMSPATVKAKVDSALASLAGAAPEALDTLQELSAALGNDANFAANVLAQIAAKLPLSGGNITGHIDKSGAGNWGSSQSDDPLKSFHRFKNHLGQSAGFLGLDASDALSSGVGNSMVLRGENDVVIAAGGNYEKVRVHQSGELTAEFQPFFKGRINSAFSLTAGWQRVPNIWLMHNNYGSHFDVSNSRMVAQKRSKWFFEFSAEPVESLTGQIYLGLYKNSVFHPTSRMYRAAANVRKTLLTTDVIHLDPGDYVEPWIYVTTGTQFDNSGKFSGILLS